MFTLMPRETVFFDLFDRSARNVHDGALALAELLDHVPEVEEHARRIKNIEHAGDELAHLTFERLHQTFITPLDREDLYRITSRLDDVLDLIDTAASRFALYRIPNSTPDAKALAQVLVKSTSLLIEAVARLRRLDEPDAILRLCIEVHTQENEGDRIERHALATLFDSGSSPIDVIKWKDIYEDLETATDRCEDVANVLEAIVLKNA